MTLSLGAGAGHLIVRAWRPALWLGHFALITFVTPASAAERAELLLRGVVPPTVGVSFRSDGRDVGGNEQGVLIETLANAPYELLLHSRSGRAPEMIFGAEPLLFRDGVAVLNGLQAVSGPTSRSSLALIPASFRAAEDAPREDLILVIRAP